MSAAPPEPPAAVVARLRAAGCVFAEDEARLIVESAGSPAELADLVARRVSGVPLEHVLGRVDFYGLRIPVDPGVFVPRRRTELLVRAAAGLLAGRPDPVVVELCCGCAAIGLALLTEVPAARLHAVDIEPAAVACARRNLAGRGEVYAGDLFDPLPAGLRGRVDAVLANAPYVPSDAVATMPAEARLYEPLVALDGGPDGLDLLRRIAAQAPAWLAAGGVLLVESSRRQAPAALAAFSGNGFTPSVEHSEELDGTVIVGRL